MNTPEIIAALIAAIASIIAAIIPVYKKNKNASVVQKRIIDGIWLGFIKQSNGSGDLQLEY